MPTPIPDHFEASLRAYAAERCWPLTDLSNGYFQVWPFGIVDESPRCTIIVALVGYDRPEATASISAHGDDECAEVASRLLPLRDSARALNAWLKQLAHRHEPAAPVPDDGPAAIVAAPPGMDCDDVCTAEAHADWVARETGS